MSALKTAALIVLIVLATACGGNGATQQITNTIADDGLGEDPQSTPELSPAPGPANSVPKVTKVNLVGINEDFSLDLIAELLEGSVLNLNNYVYDFVNITADTENIQQTGSVKFSLVGDDYQINRVENNYEYTLESVAKNINIQEGEWPEGNYTLVITSYELPNAQGMAGEPKTINIQVIGIEEPTLSSDDDFFSAVQGDALRRSAQNGLGSNDNYDSDSAIFSILTPPSYGSVVVDTNGAFEYRSNENFTGVDTFTYSITQGTQETSASVSVQVFQNQPDEPADGFTVIQPSLDSRLIYVSKSDGLDSNDCLSLESPCKSIAEGLRKMRPGFPDHVYLKRGDTWRGEDLKELESGRSQTEPSVLAFYGNTGDRPRLETTGELYREARIENLHIIGVEFFAYKMKPGTPEFSGQNADRGSLFFLGGTRNVLVEDCLFNFVELLFQGWNGENTTDVRVRRNMFTGSYYNRSSFDRNSRPSNMFMDSVDGALIEDNVFDFGGWYPGVTGAAGNMFNHNVYIQYSSVGNRIVFRNNIVTRASSLGVHGRPGGLYEDNFFARNSIGLQMGYWNQPLDSETFAIARNNIVIEGESMAKGDQACTGENLCTQALWGINVDELGEGDFQLIGNIAHSLSPNREWQNVYSRLVRIGIRFDERARYENNISWRWDSDTDGDDENYVDPGRTLEDYSESIGHPRDFNIFMDIVKSRPLQTWDDNYSARSINEFIRAGFNIQP